MTDPMSTLALVGGAAAVLFVLVQAGNGRRKDGFNPADYRAKPLLSAWEAKALAQLQADLPVGFTACPQVRLADAISVVVRDPSLRTAALNRVASKSLDFAIIDQRGRVALATELDDRSHDRPDRQQRDQLVDAVLKHCSAPIKRIRPGQKIDVRQALAIPRDVPVGIGP